ANEVMAMDERLDELYESNLRTLIHHAEHNGGRFESVVHLVLVNKAWERMGDHAKNICEDVVFLVDAVDIRHTRQCVRRGAQGVVPHSVAVAARVRRSMRARPRPTGGTLAQWISSMSSSSQARKKE